MPENPAFEEQVCPACERVFDYEHGEYMGTPFSRRVAGVVTTPDGWRIVGVHPACVPAAEAKLRTMSSAERSAFLKSGKYGVGDSQRRIDHKEWLNAMLSGGAIFVLAIVVFAASGGAVIGWGAAVVGVFVLVRAIVMYVVKVVFWRAR